MEQHTDMFGNSLRRGDFLCYPGRTGSSLYVNLAVFYKNKLNGKIQVIIPSVRWDRDDEGHSFQEEVYRKTSVEVLDRVIKIPNEYFHNDNITTELCSKATKLVDIQEKVLEGFFD